MGRLLQTPESAAAVQQARGAPNELLLKALTQNPQMLELLKTPQGLAFLNRLIGDLSRKINPGSGRLAFEAMQRGAQLPSTLLGGLPW